MAERMLPGRWGRFSRQLTRYAFVGLASNLAGYLVYLLLTYLGTTPKLTMTALYAAGATIGFFGNRTLTFEHRGGVLSAGFRYLLAHVLGYLLNLVILVVFVDSLGYPHQAVQAVAIFVVAAMLFVLFKAFVFPARCEATEIAR